MPNTLFFTNHAVEKMKYWNISESTVTDVFNHGNQIKPNMMVSKYNGYEVGLTYGTHKETGQYMIITVWKRDRR